MTGGSTLRLARQARGYSQQQLAGMAGVSRQAVSAVESGQTDPSLRVAIALARALGVTVEELFGAEVTQPPVRARLVPPAPWGGAGSGGRVALAPVGGGFVGLPLAGPAVFRAGFLPAGGTLRTAPAEDGSFEVTPIGPPRPTLVVAGCDPALPLLETPLGLLDPPVAFTWWNCASHEALRLAADGLVHLAGAHLGDADGGYNVGAASASLPGGAEVLGFCGWRQGLVLRTEHADRAGGLAGAVRLGLRLVNREPGSGARQVLDAELERLGADGPGIAGYETRATGHLQVAAAIAAGLADFGVASEPAALAYGLRFVPLTNERFDLVIPASQAGTPEVRALLRVLGSPWLAQQLASLPGYDASSCGEHVATIG